MGTSAGLYRFDKGAVQPIPLLKGSSPHITALFEDSDGRLWVGSLGQGAFFLNRGEITPHAVHARDGAAGSEFEVAGVNSIAEVVPGQVWIGTRGQGVISLNSLTGEAHLSRHDQGQPTSLQHNMIWSLYRDRSGEIWVGSSGGLDRYDHSRRAISTIFGGKGSQAGLSKLDVRSVLGSGSEANLAGVGGRGHRYRRADRTTYYPFSPDDEGFGLVPASRCGTRTGKTE